MIGFFEQISAALYCEDVVEKCQKVADLNAQPLTTWIENAPPRDFRDNPGRPALPVLVPPSQVPKRRLGSDTGKAALMHAVAHIEFNAINLALDMVHRFGTDPIISTCDQVEFVRDWLSVAKDEARHFNLISNYLDQLGFKYGDFPAHNGLWEAAQQTSHDIAARLAVAPMVLEARGLDVTPFMIEKFKKHNDSLAVEVLQTILDEEVAHVAFGTKWFRYVAKMRNKSTESYFHEQVRTHFKGVLKRPFNDSARYSAQLYEDFYLPLAIP